MIKPGLPPFAAKRLYATSLAVVSDHVQGVRLSEILSFAESHVLPIETNAALCLIRQLIHALALLHQKMPDVSHGAVGPERIVVTPQARLVLVEHVLGAALDQLHYTHEQYWKTLRIPLPRTGSGPQFDRRSDITAVTGLRRVIVHSARTGALPVLRAGRAGHDFARCAGARRCRGDDAGSVDLGVGAGARDGAGLLPRGSAVDRSTQEGQAH